MTTTAMLSPRHYAVWIVSLFIALSPSGAAAGGPDVPAPGSGMDAWTWEGVPIAPSAAQPNPAWSIRTAARKGVHDLSLPDETFAAPDAAVLRSGSFAEATSLLASFQESFAFVEPDSIAAIVRTKPYLIIPTGGLQGLASSPFFRAGLAEYVRSGGVVLCFAQQKGADLSALPVPEGQTLRALGRTEDSGPLFRASTVQAVHPALSGLRRTPPSVETDGYVVDLPRESTVLLRRQDGFPTLALYPFGGGWVVVSALASDFASGQGLLDEEERTLVRDLVLWAKAGGRPAVLEPGAQIAVEIPLEGPEQGSDSVRVTVTGPQREKPLDDRTFPFGAQPRQRALFPYTYSLPRNIAPGIYHLEYALLGGRRFLQPFSESSKGWFAVLPGTAAPREVPRAPHPLAHPGQRLLSKPRIEAAGSRFRVAVEVTRAESGNREPADLLLRGAGQEIFFKLGANSGTASFFLPEAREGQPLSYAIYHVNGRALVKGTVPAALFRRSGVVPDSAWYLPGQTARIRISGLGAGAVALSGLGYEGEQMISRDAVIEVPVPASLPAGVYPLAWSFEAPGAARKEGSLPVVVRGAALACDNVALTRARDGDTEGLTALFSLEASGDVSGTLRTVFEGPGGKTTTPREQPFAAAKGRLEMTAPVPYTPDQAGIWQLRYSFLAPPRQGPGFSADPLTLASGRVLVDAGNAAVLDVRTDPPLTYGPAALTNVTVAAAGSSGTAFNIQLDGDRIGKGKISETGSASLTVPVKDIAQGAHIIKAVLSGKDLKSVREVRFLSGALLPDLVVSLKTSDVKVPDVEVGVGITNEGKAAAPATKASLYEGDPRSGGRIINSFPVPPLGPGKQHVAIIHWPLAGKAGTRTLFAAVDEKAKIMETSRDNDLASATVAVPGVFLSLQGLKPEYRADERIDYKAQVANFTTGPLTALTMQLQATGSAAQSLGTETVALPDLAPGAANVLDRTLSLKTPPEGVYLLGARITAGGKTVAEDSRGIEVLPTLLVKGSLEGTPAATAPCRPLEIRTRAWSEGNVPPTGGTLRLEVRSRGLGQTVYSRDLPFALEAATTRIDKIAFPRGNYTVVLRGSAVNKQRDLNTEMPLVEQPLTVGDAVAVKRSIASFPRILVWAGGNETTTIEQALIEKMVKEAFAEDNAYIAVVTSAEAFTSRALTGTFNEYLLIDINETLGADEALKHGLGKGHGVVIAGSGDRSRFMAEALGFRFEPEAAKGTASIIVPQDSGLGLTGSLPLSGAALIPRRSKTARTVASFADGRPAILIDTVERGRTMVLPFSLTRSSLDSGISTVYSRLVREAVLATLPQDGGQDDLASVTLTVSSAAGPVQARLVESLPPGASVLWSSVKPAPGTPLTFEVTADSAPRTILYLFRPGKAGAGRSSTAVFSACGSDFVSQGSVE